MADFDIKSFGKSLQEYIANAIPYPYADEKKDAKKHKDRNPPHLQDQVRNEFMNNYEMIDTSKYSFDLGSEKLETIYPHYHILEDNEVIHKANMGTTQSKGSQSNLPKGQRDYGVIVARVNKNKGTTSYSQEYRKNVRGKRSAIRYDTFKVSDDNGVVTEYKKAVGTKSSTTYINVHYHYIERNLDTIIISELCTMYGLKKKSRSTSDLFDNNNDFMLRVFNV